ncbi:MAG: hypothetical protein HY236_16165 [Acidobacteria bacterium]|nr:hypothetical protein [Acidobacteriota bacterium]
MPNTFLVPETKVEENGTGRVLELGASAGGTLLLTMGITKIVEQESLDVAILGSADGNDWPAKPLIAFPQKFYAGDYSILLDLSAHPEIRFLQAKWQVNRWGVGSQTPVFTFYVFAEPVSAAKTA